MLALSTIPAEAQRHHRGGHVTVIRHSPLFWGGGFHGGFYHPYYFGFGQWYPYPYPVFGYPPGFYPGDGAVALRLQVTPRDASVYVDGYAAGVVDDYDGVFQRLRLVPGPHEIVIYHPSHRTLRQNIYYNPGSTHTIRHTLEPLLARRSARAAAGTARDACVSRNAGTAGRAGRDARPDATRALKGLASGRSRCACSRAMRPCSSTENRGAGRRRRIGS